MNPKKPFLVVNGETHYSCGCQDKVVGENYFFTPCSLDCEIYQYALEQSEKQGNTISVLVEGKTR